MKKIVSFLLLVAMLVGCIVPAVVVSAADATLTAATVEKIQGPKTDVSAKVSIANNPGLYYLKLVVYYDKTQLAQAGDTDAAFANSVFSADDSTVNNQVAGTQNTVKNSIPSDIRSSCNAFIVELYGAYDEETEDTLAVTEDGIVVELPLTVIAGEVGAYNYTVVVAAATDAEGNDVEIATAVGTINYVADPLIGIHDDFAIFTNPASVDVIKGETTVDVDVRFDKNPGIWAVRLYVVYPEALSLTDGAAAKVENSGDIYTEPTDLNVGNPDIRLDDSKLDKTFKQLVADKGIAVEGNRLTVIYYEPAAYDAIIEGNGVLCTLHFNIDESVEVGDSLDVNIYYTELDVLRAETDPVTNDAIFTYYQPEVEGTTINIIEKVCAHATTTTEHLDATCGADGYDKVVCTDECGKVLSETVIPATGEHTEGAPVIVDSTCTVAGTSTVSCTVCNKVLSETPLDLAAHTPGEAATCQAAQTCTVCGVELVAKLAHTEGAPVRNNPTCDEDGTDVYNCTECGEYIREEVVPATGHTYLQQNNIVVTPPTCTEAGYTTRFCDVCGEPKVTDPVEAWGHDEDGEVVVVESTCTVAGTKTIYCGTCGEISKVEDLDLAAHTLTAVEAYGPFCHTNGVAAHWACDECGKLFADAEGTTEVTADDLVVEAENALVYVPAAEACHVPGISEYWYCPACDCVYADAEGTMLTNRKNLQIPADCELVHMEKVEACHANGTEEYWFCPECEAVYADEAGTMLTNRMNLTIPADAEAKHVEAVAATCTENGMAEYWYCEECDTFFADAECKYNVAYLSLTIPATGHNYEDGVCTVCGDKENATEEEDKAPVTGDNVVYIVIALAAVLVSGAAIVLFRRKRTN